MSFILDALKRADQERRQEPLTVTFDSTSDSHDITPAPRSRGLIVGAVISLALILTLAGYFLVKAWPDRQPTTRATAVPITQSPATATAPKSSVTDSRSPVAEEPSSNANSNATAPQTTTPPAQIAKSQIPKSAKEIESLYVAEQPTNNSDLAVEQLYLEPEPQQTNARTETATDLQPSATSSAPQAQTPTTIKPEPTLPAMAQIRDLPWSLQQKIPSISYSSHHYDGAGRSYVVINGEQKRAGQQLEQSLRLEEILADGVVLSFEGRRFKLPALSSWVNM